MIFANATTDWIGIILGSVGTITGILSYCKSLDADKNAKASIDEAHRLTQNLEEKTKSIDLLEKLVAHACKCKEAMLDLYRYQEDGVRTSESAMREYATLDQKDPRVLELQRDRKKSIDKYDELVRIAFSNVRESHAWLNADKGVIGALHREKGKECQDAVSALIEYGNYYNGPEPLFRKVAFDAYQDHIIELVEDIGLKFSAMFTKLEIEKWNLKEVVQANLTSTPKSNPVLPAPPLTTQS